MKNTNHYLFPDMEAYLNVLHVKNRATTARTAGQALEQCGGWLKAQSIDPLRATAQELQQYLSWLTVTYKSPVGKPLAKTTVAARIAYIKGWYQWLEDRGQIVADPSRRLYVKVTRSRVVVKEHLTLQESMALLQTQSEIMNAQTINSYAWRMAVRNRAIMCVELATGRRIGGLINLKVQHIDAERNEIRVEREKGRTGRVLPIAGWAMDAVQQYLQAGRPHLVDGEIEWLFLNRAGDGPITRDALKWILQELLKQTIAENPDLEELPQKRICWHSLRVTFATMLFANGCDIRTVNELLLHRCLSTTARYTPVPVDDLRHVCTQTHPRK